MTEEHHHHNTPGKKAELSVFLLLTVLLVPAITIAGIGGYGLVIWLAQ